MYLFLFILMEEHPVFRRGQLNGAVGVGIDTREFEKFKSFSSSNPFVLEHFTKKEINYSFSKSNPSFYLAKIFAVKNAVLKAAGVFEKSMPFLNIEISFKKEVLISFLNIDQKTDKKVMTEDKKEKSEDSSLIFDENDVYTPFFDSFKVSISRKKTSVTAVVVREKKEIDA